MLSRKPNSMRKRIANEHFVFSSYIIVQTMVYGARAYIVKYALWQCCTVLHGCTVRFSHIYGAVVIGASTEVASSAAQRTGMSRLR